MRCLITGGNGFIGRNVIPFLQDEYLILTRLNFHEIKPFAPEVVVNLAWNGVGDADDRDNERLQKTNVDFNNILFNTCKPSCKRWIGVGSQTEINSPTTPYAKYKMAVSNYISRLCDDIDFVWLRIYSIYGPGNGEKQFIPYIINTLLNGRNVALTNQNIPWDYLYVKDAGKAVAALIGSNITGVVELGSGETRMTQDIARLIRDKINPKLDLLFGTKPSRNVEHNKLVADISKLSGIWKPETTFDDGLDRTIDYYRKL